MDRSLPFIMQFASMTNWIGGIIGVFICGFRLGLPREVFMAHALNFQPVLEHVLALSL